MSIFARQIYIYIYYGTGIPGKGDVGTGTVLYSRSRNIDIYIYLSPCKYWRTGKKPQSPIGQKMSPSGPGIGLGACVGGWGVARRSSSTGTLQREETVFGIIKLSCHFAVFLVFFTPTSPASAQRGWNLRRLKGGLFASIHIDT